MPNTKPLAALDHSLITASDGAYIVAEEATGTPPLVTPNAGLVSKDRHIVARSSGATVVARSSGRDLYSRGGTRPFTSPKSPLVSR